MGYYDLTDSSEFVGYGSGLTGLQVVKAKKKDDPKPSSRSFTPITTINVIGSPAPSNYTELKVFNGTVTANALPGLMADLRDRNLWVNRDGYCYIWIAGSNSSNPPRPAKFMRLNDLFNWEDYVDSLPTGQTFTPTPSTTVWNRQDFSGGTTKVDYEKLDADLKQAKDDKKKADEDKKKAEIDKKKAEDDKKKAENDKKKAEDDKKRAEDDKKKAEIDKKRAEDDKKKADEDKKKAEIDKKRAEDDKKRAENDKKRAEDDKKRAENDKKRAEDDKKRAENDKKKAEDDKKKAETDYRDLHNRLGRMKSQWDNAVAIGCLPLHSWAFQISKTPKPRQEVIFSRTWMGNNGAFLAAPPGRISDYNQMVGKQPLVIYNSNDYFEKHFWWVAKMYFKNYPAYNYLIAFSGNGITENSFDGQIFADKLTCGTYNFPGIYWDVDTIVIKPL